MSTRAVSQQGPRGPEVTRSAGREGHLRLFLTALLCLCLGTTRPSAVPTHLSLVHFTAGAGSPTELQGSWTSFIQGVVTVPPNEMIFAGATGK